MMTLPKLVSLKRNTPNFARILARGEEAPRQVSRRRQMVRLYLTAILLLSLMFTLYIWQSTKMVEVKLRIKSLETHIQGLETNNAVLRAEISKLQSISRIEKVAKSDLGMVVPKKLCYIPMPAEFLQARR